MGIAFVLTGFNDLERLVILIIIIIIIIFFFLTKDFATEFIH